MRPSPNSQSHQNNPSSQSPQSHQSDSSQDLETVISYMKSHWPSAVKPEWQVPLEAYPKILEQVLADLTPGATKTAHFIRIAGLSGSGKTTQILPAVEAYSKKQHLKPILLAARIFVKYHPHYQAILDFYGEADLRKMTDEFSTIMLFLTIKALTAAGYDLILDVTFLDPKIEAILQNFLGEKNYQSLILMVATSPTVTEHFLSDRPWRHTKKTEQEFIRATSLALEFYAQSAPKTRIIIWSVYDQPPAYDGPIKNCLETFNTLSQKTDLPQKDDDARRTAKIAYLSKT